MIYIFFMTPNELMKFYLLARIINWRHELELLDAQAVADLIKILKSANNTLRLKIEQELPQVWASYTPDKGGAAIRLWLGELLTDPAMQVENTITEAWSISAQSSLAAYNDILSFGGMAKNILTVPITVDAIKGLASKKLFAGYTMGQLVAKSFTEGQITAVIDALNNGIAKGWGYPKVIDDLEQKALEAGAEINRRQAITLARSYIQQASVNAQLSVYENNKNIVKGVEWCAILDNRICPLCFTGATEVAPIGKLRGVTKRPYVGDIITITTASGFQVSTTPKHPILTPEGWCAFEKLNPGDQVIYAEKSDVLNILGKQEIDMPAKFSELFDFFSSQSFSEVKRYCTSADAFNGDSGIFNSYITTICKNSLLESNVGYPALAQFIPYKGFAFSNSSLIFFSSNSTFNSLFNRMYSWAFWLSSFFNTSFIKCFMNHAYSKTLPMQIFWRKSLQIQLNNFIFFLLAIITSIRFRNIWHSFVFDKKIGNGGSANGKMSCDFTGRNSLPVHCENIVSIRREWRSCHVYNLHCDEELYTANGFIVKNCAATDGLKYTFEEEKPPMPRHPRCLLPESLVTAPDAIAKFVSNYEGPVYDIWLENGSKLSVTPNHPIMTKNGFVAACLLNEQSEIICNDFHTGIGEFAGERKEIADILVYGKEITGSIRKIKFDDKGFHGDAKYFKKKESIIFIRKYPEKIDIDERFALRNLLDNKEFNISIEEIFTKKDRDDKQAIKKWLYQFRNRISLYKVVHIRQRDYKGYVYDLQTISSLFYADGAIVSNCRCLWLPWVKSWRDLGIDADDLEKAARPWVIREKGNIDEGGLRKIENFGKTTEDFPGWWKTLPYEEQIRTIGPVRTKLINSGILTWRDLMDKHSGRFFTLHELGFDEAGRLL